MLLLPVETSASLMNTVHHAEFSELCERVYRAGIRVDMALFDPPYGTTTCQWDTVIPFDVMWYWLKKLVKPRGAIVITASQPFTTALIASNYEMFKYCWVWDKVAKGDVMNAKNKPLKQHEDVCIFSLGTTANGSPSRMNYYPHGVTENTRRPEPNFPKANSAFRNVRPSSVEIYQRQGANYPSSIITFSNADHTESLHPTQKPAALFSYLIRTYTLPGELVFDPTCGSGTTAVAARAEGRRYIVGDNSPEYVAIAKDRLRMPLEKLQVVSNNNVDDLPLFAVQVDARASGQ